MRETIGITYTEEQKKLAVKMYGSVAAALRYAAHQKQGAKAAKRQRKHATTTVDSGTAILLKTKFHSTSDALEYALFSPPD